jgi:hypothetical protein
MQRPISVRISLVYNRDVQPLAHQRDRLPLAPIKKLVFELFCDTLPLSSSRILQAGHVARIVERRSACKDLVGKLQRKEGIGGVGVD